MNDDSYLKRSVLNGERVKLLRPNASKEIRAGIVALGVSLALVLLNGCASVGVQGHSDPWQYNLNTGYPAVGDSRPWRP
jgi:hypothetical protein